MCDTCQDCGCSNITLPTGATGATGATGGAGADGANGTSGTAVLYNDTTQSTTANAAIALFAATKAYTMPANTLSTNGSKIKLTALFSTSANTFAGNSTAYVYFAGASYVADSVPTIVPFILNYWTDNDLYLKVVLEITRVSTTVLFIDTSTYIADVYNKQELGAYHFKTASLAVADLSANTLLIEMRGKTTGTTTFNCDQLIIEHLIK